MTRRDWWLGILAVVLAVLLHAALPRYEWRPYGQSGSALVRIDRWTGHAYVGRFHGSYWKTFSEIHDYEAAHPAAPQQFQ